MKFFIKSLSLLLFSNLIFANAININPIHLVLTPKDRTGIINVNNVSTQNLYFQVISKKWRQNNGQNLYSDTDDLVVSPPFINIAPKQSAIVRVALRRAPQKVTIEHAYRVYFQQLPIEKNIVGKRPSLQVLLRVGVPIFFQPYNIKHKLKASAIIANKKLKVILKNLGNIHSQINSVELKYFGSKETFSPTKQSFDLLPNAIITWTFPYLEKNVNKPLILFLQTAKKPVKFSLHLL